jgi:prefoldin beta subunit
MAKENKDSHGHAPTAPNPLANLDEETQQKIQQLQMMEQSFQQLLMQKNAFSMEANETDFIIKEVEKTKGEVSRIIGNQVVIKATKEEILEDMENKKKLIDTRMKSIDEQEKEFSQKIEEIRKEVMEKIQR